MCIMATDAVPSSTRIYMVPVTVDGLPFTCMLYTNDLDVKAGVPGLMIVPFPNPSGSTRFGLVDARSTTGFRKKVNKAMQPLFMKKQGYSARSMNLGAATDAMAPGHEVGNYRCTIAPNLDALFTSINWARFTVPSDLDARLSVLRDTSVVPPHCGFVIAEAMRSVKEDGFGVVFPGNHSFFPTCHEGTSATHTYDTQCYGFNALLPEGTVFQDADVMRELETSFAPSAVWSHNGSPMVLRPGHFSFGSSVMLMGVMTNANTTGLYCHVQLGAGSTGMDGPKAVAVASPARPIRIPEESAWLRPGLPASPWASVWPDSGSSSSSGGGIGIGGGTPFHFPQISGPVPAPVPAPASAPDPFSFIPRKTESIGGGAGTGRVGDSSSLHFLDQLWR